MSLENTAAATPGTGLAPAAGLVRPDRPLGTANGPRRQVRRLSGHVGDRLLGRPVFHRAGRLARAAPLSRAAAGRGRSEALIEPVCGDWCTLAEFGALKLTIGYYIDALTVAMFCMVSLVASCIHVYSFGYMHEELEEVTDPLVALADGSPLRRRGRFHRFFQYLSLFCFSMLGLVIAGNLFMVFAFWELVGICSYLLIGFYIERKTASNAANKAFIVNRVGDFGMIIGLMAIWTGLGTFSFGDVEDADGDQPAGHVQPGAARGRRTMHRECPDGMVRLAARGEAAKIAADGADAGTAERADCRRRAEVARPGLRLLAAGGGRLGHFLRLRRQERQFPLHVWLPDAMEGPTPVGALIHAATMVAAGVYWSGAFIPSSRPRCCW